MLLIGGEHDKVVAQFAEALQKYARDKLPASWQSEMEAGETTPPPSIGTRLAASCPC
jgi:hypothetical protein